MVFYPVVNGTPARSAFHGEKFMSLHKDIAPPMAVSGPRHFYVDELVSAALPDGRIAHVLPQRFFFDGDSLRVHVVEVQNASKDGSVVRFALTAAAWVIDIPVSSLYRTREELEVSNEILETDVICEPVASQLLHIRSCF